jgi:tetratricopeptide (TPR) repeat protein
LAVPIRHVAICRQMPDSQPPASPVLQDSRQQFLLTLLAFAFGFLFVVILLIFALVVPDPSDWQIFVCRVVLALAAAGVAAVIPGMLNLKLGNWLTAGGAVAVFVIVFFLNPPALIMKAKVSALSDRATIAFLSGRYSFAKTLYQNAIELSPSDPEPVANLADVEYELGNYVSAKQLFEDAYNKSGPNEMQRDKKLLHKVALIFEGMQDFDAAINVYERIRPALAPNSDFYLDLVFSESQVYLKKFMNGRVIKYLDDAENGFSLFLEQKGQPRQWAYYHLACISAIRSTEKDDQKESKNAIDKFTQAVEELKHFKGDTALDHYNMLKHLLSPRDFYPWRPGFPVECPELRELVRRADPTIISNL